MTHLKINMNADDCILYISGNDWTRMLLRIQPELDNIQEWFSMNPLGVSLDKEMTLSSLLSDTKKSVLNKLSSLRKLRYCINQKSALSI